LVGATLAEQRLGPADNSKKSDRITAPARRQKSDKTFDRYPNYSFFGDPGMTRTCDLRFRKPSLYPAELRDRIDFIQDFQSKNFGRFLASGFRSNNLISGNP
jgi:hypothetical protein